MLNEELLVEMRWSSVNKNKYVQRGYTYTKMGDIFLAKVKDVLELSSGQKIPVYCDFCGELYYPTSRNYQKVKDRKECDCCASCKGKKIKLTVQDKYGVSNVMQCKEVRTKHQETCMEKYGSSSPLACRDIYDKTQQSFNLHYNVENGISDLRRVKELSDKIGKTNIKKYGGISPFCSSKIRKEIRETLYRNGTCPTSKKQLELRDMIEQVYGNCELNYPCDKVSLDCMTIIKGIKIDIEYDGWYWHKDTKEKDKRRDYYVKSKGYKILRILAYEDRLPTKEELVQGINFLLNSDKKFKRIELNKY